MLQETFNQSIMYAVISVNQILNIFSIEFLYSRPFSTVSVAGKLPQINYTVFI